MWNVYQVGAAHRKRNGKHKDLSEPNHFRRVVNLECLSLIKRTPRSTRRHQTHLRW